MGGSEDSRVNWDRSDRAKEKEKDDKRSLESSERQGGH